MHSKDAPGLTFARYLCSTLWQEEDYFLQLDSHVRMVKDWDKKLIQTVKQIQIKTRNPRIALSTYADTMDSYPKYLAGDPDVVDRPPCICQAFFNQDGMISLHGARTLPKTNPVHVPFIGAGFVFCPTKQFLQEVPFNLYLDDVFVGEEILLSARLWMHGWDVYTPSEHIVFHHFTRSSEPKFWEHHERNNKQGMQRVTFFLNLSKQIPSHSHKG
ncbi:hypothetical protein HK102_001435, partial [Quaeritorhiza haematococci]